MRQNTYKSPQPPKRRWIRPFSIDKRYKIALGVAVQGCTLFLCMAFIAHFFHGKVDQSTIESAQYNTPELPIQNWLGLLGAMSAYYCLFRGWGVTAFLLLLPLYALGHQLVYPNGSLRLYRITLFAVFSSLWLNITLGYIETLFPTDCMEHLLGGVGFALGHLFQRLLGMGTFIFSLVSLLIFIVCFFSITSLQAVCSIRLLHKKKSPSPIEPFPSATSVPLAIEPEPILQTPTGEEVKTVPLEIVDTPPLPAAKTTLEAEETCAPATGNYDPTLELASYHYPPIHLLNQHDLTKIQVTPGELAQNKDKIVETLINFKIGISSIKATIGPTVTLYEIVPEVGIKISKIKNLEDDIALNLAALGIRIIAPIPGKGTIGIEVPNKQREIVPLNVMLATDPFMRSSMELPIMLGKTISNEAFMADLTRMPHLLIAGATGQGKSVGLNVVLASLIYKKHPAQLKFVLVDPKKVELSLYNQLERHFLAKLPGNEEAIITATKNVVHTLNSLCIEMDHRYELLKEAGTRNIQEYNDKFIKRKLNPEQGHRFLPYIVLVIDEFADLMLTAGKEIEVPIARLAQLARAIGIHLVLATQRPSVNVITGIIKANFPVRISFKVTSKIDSRTILDTGGAEQLVGQGDMLLSMNADLIRLQCPFLDTEEVERICSYIGSQRGYASAYLLPDYEEDQEESQTVDLTDRDPLFEEAARMVVAHQQGSTSLIQRKLKLGYNRAGRLMDQLEAAGVVGPFEGSKAREVLQPDEYSLERLFKSLEEQTVAP